MFSVFLQQKCLGQVIFDEVVRKLNLLESDYFDLEYTDAHGVPVSRQSINIHHIHVIVPV